MAEEPFAGTLAKTRLETVHWSLPAGEMAAVRVHTVVNATSDPALAERLLTGDLNWVQPAGSDELQQVLLPLVYHDEDRRIFALILPPSYRSRELDERAALLQRLARDTAQPVPSYVVRFDVVYGEEGLGALLARATPEDALAQDEPDLARREEEIVAREAKLAEWEARIEQEQSRLALDLRQRQLMDEDVSAALQAELRRREADLGRREAALREVERLVVERQTELDRREERIHRQPMPAPTETDSPTRVAHRESLELAARDSEGHSEAAGLLDGPSPLAVASPARSNTPDGELREAQRELQARLGQSFRVTTPDPTESPLGEELDDSGPQDRQPLGGEPILEPLDEEPPTRGQAWEAQEPALEADEPEATQAPEDEPGQSPTPVGGSGMAFDDPWAELAGSDTGASAVVDAPARKRPSKTQATPLDAALLEAVAEEARKHQAEEEEATAALPDEEAVHSSAPEVPTLPAELSAWYEDEGRGPRWYLTEQGVHLAVCLPGAEAEAFVGLEPAALLQLHGFESFAWITLAVVAAVEDEAPPVIHWPLDVRDDRARSLLDRLAVDFRFALEIYDDLLEPVTTQELHYPLEENVRVVRDRAQQWIGVLSAHTLDPVSAWEAFQAPGYHRLEPGSLELDPGAYQQLGSAKEVAQAVAVVARWSVPEKEDELLLKRSFPAAAWRSLRLRALRAAIEYGIWMNKDLRRLALDAGYATSRRDLLRACLAGFERVGVGELKGGLEPAREHENWRALFEEAELLGVAVEPRWEELSEAALTRAGGDSEGAQEAQGYTDQLERLDEADLLEAEELPARSLAAGKGAPAPDLEEDVVGEPEEGQGEVQGPSGRRGGQRVHQGGPLSGGAELEELSMPELVAMLSSVDARLGAALELCRRSERRALPELFALLSSLERTELLRLAPRLVGFGTDAVPLFGEMLRSSGSLLRVLAAQALGALGAQETLDGLIDLLLDEPTEHWRGVASALGDFGRSAMMSLASRIRHSSAEQRTRITVALAEVSLREGCRELLLDLTGSRDEEAGALAVEALRQAAVLREGLVGTAPLSRDQPVALFTRRLLATLGGQDRELEEGDIIEADDIVEEGDVLGEEALPKDPDP